MAVKYRIHAQVALERIAGRFFLIAYGDAGADLPYLCEINETGAFYWKLAEEGYDSDAMLNAAFKEYEVPPELLNRGLQVFLQVLTEKGYLIKEPI